MSLRKQLTGTGKGKEPCSISYINLLGDITLYNVLSHVDAALGLTLPNYNFEILI